MALTVAELLDLPHLQMSRVTGGAGALRRSLTWAHVCELPDPTPWLEGGELVLTTGMAIPTAPTQQACYVARLSRHGIAALAVSADMHAPELSRQMRQTAEACDFPILLVPLEVPFLAISRVVAAAAQDSLRDRLLTQVRVLDSIRLTTRDNLDLPGLLRHIEPRLGYDLYLVGADGSRLLPDLPHPPSAVVERLWPRDGPLPARIAEGFVVTIPLSARSAAYLLAIERQPTTDNADLATVHHAATLAALQLERIYREREVVRREGAETLSELLSGTLEGESARRRLELAGFDVDQRFVMVALGDQERSRDATFHQRLSEEGTPHLLLIQQELLALLPADAPVEKLLATTDGATAGASAPFGFGSNFSTGKREALWALRQARELGVPYTAFAVEAEGAGLLPHDPGLLHELVERILGPVRTYDQERGTELLRSVRTWLEHDRRIAPAAAALHVHDHTLRYRLARVAEITGRTLTGSRDIVEFWLAFQALELEA